jgi:hypothetical protein
MVVATARPLRWPAGQPGGFTPRRRRANTADTGDCPVPRPARGLSWPVAPRCETSSEPHACCRRCLSAWPSRALLMEPSPRVTSSIRISLSDWAPGTPGACITPPPAPLPGTLTLKGAFAVLDSGRRRLHRHAHERGYTGLASYLHARCQQQASPAQLASELGTTTPVVRRLLGTAGITPSPRRVTAAHTRRATTDRQLTIRAAEPGFASLRACLADRR